MANLMIWMVFEPYSKGSIVVNDSGWYHPEMNSYLPSDPPLEEDKAFEIQPPFSNDAHVPLGSPWPIVPSNSTVHEHAT
jgi:hypothetical protein